LSAPDPELPVTTVCFQGAGCSIAIIAMFPRRRG
jgi:hypothetical protein